MKIKAFPNVFAQVRQKLAQIAIALPKYGVFLVFCAKTAKGLKKPFGLINEYNDRLNKKLSGTHLIDEKPNFFVTSARPGNFGDHLDFKVNIDNWFDENRCFFRNFLSFS